MGVLVVYLLCLSVRYIFSFYIFFFFQAEDGIRDGHVTGVQTCALPILSTDSPGPTPGRPAYSGRNPTRRGDRAATAGSRSEERRVGKECRSRWGPDQ